MQVYLVIVSSVGYPSAGPDLYFKTLLQKFSDVYMEWYSEPLYIPHSASPVVPAWPSLFPLYLHSIPQVFPRKCQHFICNYISMCL